MASEIASGLWRSVNMSLLQLHVQREAAHDTILNLGKQGIVQFRDLNPHVSAFQRLFTNDVRRCEDNERRLRFFEEQMKKGRLVPDTDRTDTNKETLDTLEPRLENWECELRDLNSRYEQLVTQKNQSLEYKEVLDQPAGFFRGDTTEMPTGSVPGDEDVGARIGGLKYLTGVINSDRYDLFKRLVFRATRGNMFMKGVPCNPSTFIDPVTRQPVHKQVFVVFFSAQRALEKIKKLCESQSATLFPYNIENPEEVTEAQNKVNDTLQSLERVIQVTEKVRDELLEKIRQELYAWKITVTTEKSVHNILNMLSFKGQTVVAECWCPSDQLEAVRHCLQEAERSSGAQVNSFIEEVHTRAEPPTHFNTNKFTGTYQGIVESYGIGRYKEVNPTVFTIITFPFLFGVMYGDLGHGVCITVFSLILIGLEKKLLKTPLNEIIAIIFNGRYLLVLMGLFAIWMGFLYNDMFGTMISPFNHTYWAFPENAEEAREICDDTTVKWWGQYASDIRACAKKDGYVNPMGVDSDWQETEGKLEFVNGIKMKGAVILGVMQMLLGEMMALCNHLYFNDRLHLFFGFIPEVIFLLFTFGYMDFLIFLKWLTNWGVQMEAHHSPPSLLETMTSFFLSPGHVPENSWLYLSSGAQGSIQLVMLVIAVISVPVLLIPIPVLKIKALKANRYGNMENDDEEDGDKDGEPNEVPEASEIWIAQIIHTIEYVLGTVSNTASYLRLWALSLAHAELSEVFWDFGIMQVLTGHPMAIMLTWSGWAGATIGVLLLMEALSAFLHALRLHWVEFQNKFYKGDGTKFVPYDIESMIPQPHVLKHQFEAEEGD